MLRHRTKGTALLMTLLTTAVPAGAADVNGQFAIEGGGLQTCQRFLEAGRGGSPDYAAYGGWIEGYITAQNQSIEGVFDLTPWQNTITLLSLTGSICQQMPPDTRFIDALHQLIRQLVPTALRSESDLVALRAGASGTVLYKATVASLQLALKARGSDIIDPQGEFGASTSRAISDWQKANGLEQTGLPDQKILFDLLMKPQPG